MTPLGPLAGMTAPLTDALSADPAETALLLAGLALVTVAAASALRRLDRHLRSVRHQVLAVVLVALAVGAGAATALARLMVFDGAQLRNVVAVLATTAVVAVVLVVVASAPLGRDFRSLEQTVRSIERGERSVRSEVSRSDELGEVARAVDGMVTRLDELERERAGYEAERTALLSSVSHDLRTPLAALRAALEALTDGVAADPDRYLRSMHHHVTALTALVDDLFLLTRMEAGRLDLTREVTDLAEVVDGAVECLAPVAVARGVTMTLDVSGRTQVSGDPSALGRVVRNLIDNAIRHAPTGTDVAVVVSSDTADVRVSVADHGPGFPAEFVDAAFDRFTRADASRDRATGGTGLGLAIARGLIDAHGGRIWIEGPPGGRVRFSLPLAPSAARRHRPPVDGPTPGPARSSTGSGDQPHRPAAASAR